MVTYNQTVTATITATTTPTRGSKDELSSLSPEMTPGEAAGLTVGLVLLVILLVAAEVAFLTRRRRKRMSEESERGGLMEEAPGDRQLGTATNEKKPGLKRWRWPQPAKKRRQRQLENRAENRHAFISVATTDNPSGAPPWLSSPELPGDNIILSMGHQHDSRVGGKQLYTIGNVIGGGKD